MHGTSGSDTLTNKGLSAKMSEYIKICTYKPTAW
jgi:hypothetical protein